MKEKQYNLDIPFFFLEQPLTWRRQCSTNICKVKSAVNCPAAEKADQTRDRSQLGQISEKQNQDKYLF